MIQFRNYIINGRNSPPLMILFFLNKQQIKISALWTFDDINVVALEDRVQPRKIQLCI